MITFLATLVLLIITSILSMISSMVFTRNWINGIMTSIIDTTRKRKLNNMSFAGPPLPRGHLIRQRKRSLLTINLAAFVLFFIPGCYGQQKAVPDCNCSPHQAAVDEVSIHTLQTARFSGPRLIEYLHGKCLKIDTSADSLLRKGGMEGLRAFPVLICGIPGSLVAADDIAKFEAGPILTYGFSTNLDLVDSVSKE